MSRAWRIGLALSALAAAALAVSLALGSRAIAPLDLLRVLFAPDGSVDAQIVHELRLPRALAAFGTGGLLALAGALMQVLLRNPLADPYVMGASGGAAVGALGAMLLGAGGAVDRRAARSAARWPPPCWCSRWRGASSPARRSPIRAAARHACCWPA